MADTNVPRFTKSDYLNATQLAKKLGYPVEIIQKALKLELLKGTQIEVNHGRRNLVVRASWSHRRATGENLPLRLHPLGMDKFKEILNKGKEK